MTTLSISKIFIKMVALLKSTFFLKIRRAESCNASKKTCKKLEILENLINQVIKAAQIRPRKLEGQENLDQKKLLRL